MSRSRAGDVVEVCSKEEILATLDEQGCIDGLPFMPEMLQFCGHRLPVRAVAHKTCETALKTAQGRRLDATVHLGELRCDGSAHGGCQAECTLLWKDAWLKPASENAAPSAHARPHLAAPACSEERLMASALSRVDAAENEPYYACQATRIFDATELLPWWDLRQYVFDVVSRNHSLGRVLRVTWLSALRRLVGSVQRIPLVRSVVWRFSEGMHRLLTGRGMPTPFRTVEPCQKTPTGRLDLEPGELVRIKPKLEIERTLDKTSRNRGLFFDPEEMAPFCGGTYRVHSRVTQILDEATGKMLRMKEPCIILEGVACRAEYARCRLNCPRAFYSYWREIWLDRVDAER